MKTYCSILLFFKIFFSFTAASAVHTRLTWVNGIGYSLEHMEAGAKTISEIFGGKRVSYCHNPTAMSHEDDLVGYLGDLSQAGTQKLGRITEEVNALVSHLQDAVSSVGPSGKVIHIAHSQGALVTALAVRRLSANETSKIEVIGFGGAASLHRTAATPFRRCVNYYSANDPLLLLNPSAAQALRSGFTADEEFCFLAPRVGDPLADHALLGPTYREALIWEGKRFQLLHQSLIYRLSWSTLLWTINNMVAFETKMQELVKALMRSLLLVVMFLRSRFIGPMWAFVKCRVIAPFIVLLLVLADRALTLFKPFNGEGYLPVDNLGNEAVRSKWAKPMQHR